jgi:hypothetical protein
MNVLSMLYLNVIAMMIASHHLSPHTWSSPSRFIPDELTCFLFETRLQGTDKERKRKRFLTSWTFYISNVQKAHRPLGF